MTTDGGLLVLFDCDGTLFLGKDELVQPTMLEALGRLTGSELPDDAMEELDHEARPARRLARAVVRELDLPDVDLDEWVELVVELYTDRAGDGAPESWRAPAGAAKALETLCDDGFRLALLTAIPEGIARTRLARLGLEEFFPGGQGAFGCEAEEREELLRLALERAGSPPHRAAHVGDASRDIRSALALGIHAIVVAYDAEPPRGAERAEIVVGSMEELVAALRDLSASLDNGSSSRPGVRRFGRPS